MKPPEIRRRPGIPLVLAVAALLLSGVLGWRHLQLRSLLEGAHHQAVDCRRQAETLRKELVGLRGKAAAEAAGPGRQAIERELRRQGTSREALVADLLSRPELIPIEGVLGGRMRIPGPEAVRLLTPRWVMAYVEDGHVAGELLLAYRVEEGSLRWTVLDARRL